MEPTRRRLPADSTATLVGFALTLAVLLAGVGVADRNTRRLADANAEVARTYEVLNGLEKLLSTLKDAETGQRGYIVTGNPEFLQPYDEALTRVEAEYDAVRGLTAGDPAQRERLIPLRQHMDAKLAELKRTIDLRRTGPDAAVAIVKGGRGKAEMDAVRAVVAAMVADERQLMAGRADRAATTLRQSRGVELLTAAAGLLMLGSVAALVRRQDRRRRRTSATVAEQKERLRVTLACIGDGVIATDAAGVVTSLNAVAEALTGWAGDEAVGRPLADIFRIVNESTRRAVENPATRALRDGVVVGLANHTLLVARDGTERPIDDSAGPIRDKAGTVVGCVLVFRDVTERKRTEDELRRSNAILRAVSDGTPDLIFVKDRAARLVFANPATLRVIGKPPAEVLGKTDAEWNDDPAEGGVLMANDLRIMNSGQPQVVDEVHTGPLGTRTYQSVKSPMRDESGAVVGVIGTARDVTDRRRDEAALRDAEARLRLALSAARMVAWQYDPTTGVVTPSDNAAEVYGLPPGETLSVTGRSVGLVHPADAERYRATLQRAVEECGHYECEYRVVRPIDGAVIWLEERGQAVGGPPGSPATRIDGVSIDITERKRAEEEFRAMAENIPQLAWMARPDGHIYWYNRRWYAYTGMTPESQAGWGWQRVHDPAELPKVVARWTASIASGEPFDMVFPLKGADGAFRPFLTRVMPVKDADGRVIKWFGTNTDISEQRAAEEELRQLTADLSEADRRKDEFLATLAHELRNPLAPIRNGLHLLRLADAWSATRSLDMMDRQLAQMVRLVDDLLDISRVSRGKLELRRERVDLRAVVEAAVEDARPQIEKAGHEFAVALPAEPIPVEGDATRLAQVVTNLLSNSAKYTPSGGHVRLAVGRDGGEVVVTVTDDGVGIPPAMLGRVFEMFTQVDRTLEKTTGGLGIGL